MPVVDSMSDSDILRALWAQFQTIDLTALDKMVREDHQTMFGTEAFPGGLAQLTIEHRQILLGDAKAKGKDAKGIVAHIVDLQTLIKWLTIGVLALALTFAVSHAKDIETLVANFLKLA